MQFLKHVDGMHDVLKDVNVSLTLVILYAAEAIILGFQHFIVMLGTTVIIPSALVPQMGGGNEEKARVVQTILFVAGINTLLQTFFGTRLPVVMGGSYIFVAPTISIILAGRYSNETDPREVPHRSCALFITLVSVSLGTSFIDKLLLLT
jgi:xanthine/uracil permease